MTTLQRKKTIIKRILWILLGMLLLALLFVGVLFFIHVLRVTSSPSIDILSPVKGQTAPSLTPFTIQAMAKQRRVPIRRLDLYLDGFLYGSVSGESDSLLGRWNWTPVLTGDHELAFIATNTRGVMNIVQQKIEVTPVADTDHDGIPDSIDVCPEEYGYSESHGCLHPADIDGDGLIGDDDACPEVFGFAIDGGCPPDARPDTDGDGILDRADLCPEESGLAELAGCPVESWFVDRDGDAIPDFLDRCPDEAGTGEALGCPHVTEGDADGDGIADAEDDCPDEPGGRSTRGCPLEVSEDSDGDGVADSVDRCPEEAGVGSGDGCPIDDWLVDTDLDFIPDLFDLAPDLPGLFEWLGLPLAGDTDSDGVPDSEDRCPELAGSPADCGCPRFTLPLADIARQNLFSPFAFAGGAEPGGVGAGSKEAAYPNDIDRDGVHDRWDDECVGEHGEPAQRGCAPVDDDDRDGIPNHIDRCDTIPGLYWGEYTDTYMFGCPREPAGEVNLELSITAARTPTEMQAIYCFAHPFPKSPVGLVNRIPPPYRNYSVDFLERYGYYLRLRDFRLNLSIPNVKETEVITLYIACWGQPKGISLPARFLGEIYREVPVQDWDSQVRYAGGVGDSTMLEVFYRVCRNHCP